MRGTAVLSPRLLILLPSILRSYVLATAIPEPEIHDDDTGLFTFVSRPDIRPPKWEIEVYDRSALAPGYWFFGPYETLNMDDSHGNGWIGPHIYDTDGSLIWSGAPMFDNGNIEDFRISNVDGKELMTLMDQRHSKGVFIDNHFREVARKPAHGPQEHTFNSHEFHFVDNGTKALVVYTDRRVFTASQTQEALGQSMPCHVACDGINEYDVKTWESSWSWDSCDHIGLEESMYKLDFLPKQCEGLWDYVHANSIDKTHEGDYIYSCRHANAIYKISKDDGHIIWRLGGTKSDFVHKGDFVFSRQHDIRYRGGNSTHMIISMLDNAKGLDAADPTHPFSRGMLIALDESSSPMTAEIIAHYDHPEGDGGLAFRRGNYQPLPNGNVFMCWSERALQSEHSADGTLLMQAKLATKFLGTYRAYKFEFTGLPDYPPDVVARTVDTEAAGGTMTEVYVSWNGATEVASWKLYKTTKRSKPRILVDERQKVGFETQLHYDGYAQYVLVEPFDKQGNSLRKPRFVKVPMPDNTTPAVEDELAWQKDPSVRAWYDAPLLLGAASLGALVIALLGMFAIFRRLRRGRAAGGAGSRRNKRFMDIFSRGRYALLNNEKELQDQRAGLMNGRSGRRGGSSDDDYWDGGDFRDEHDPFVVGKDDDEEEDEGSRRERGRVGNGDVDLDRLEGEEELGKRRA